MSKMDYFNERYNTLNTQQKEAVNTIEGPVMVIAGPGTGKTSILTLRIANILKKTDVSPENILALTFTESGVRAMREKLVSIIGTEGYKVNIYTFHSFANDIINKYPEYFPRIIGSLNATEIDQIKIIENILDNNDFESLKTYGDPYYYVYKIISEIKHLKREGISPAEYKKFVKDQRNAFDNDDDNFNKKGKIKSNKLSLNKKMKRNEELVDVFEKYQNALLEKRLIDFEDMILELVNSLKENEELLLILQEEYQYILADEHQDTNNAQNKVLELLASFHDNPNLFIVGDEKQAIFRFQGASLQNFLYFKNLYKDNKIITLEKNYRSTQSILDNAHQLIENNKIDDKDLRKKLESNSKESKPIDVYSFNNTDYENMFLIKDIESKIKEGIDPNEIAILYRNNKDVFEIARFFEKTKIPFVIYSNQDLLSNPDIKKILIILNSISDLTNDVHLGELLHVDFLDLDEYDIHKIISNAYKNKEPIYKIISDDKTLRKISVKDIDKFIKLGESLKEWSKKSKNISTLKFIEFIINKSGLLKNILSETIEYERLKIIDAFFNEIRKVVEGHKNYSLKDLLEHFEILSKYNIRINYSQGENQKGVKMMTAHRSKGLEFDHVYITSATDRSWGSGNSKTYFESPFGKDSEEEKNADERRLFYVAITRARKHVVITNAKENINGDKTLPARFIEELNDDLVNQVNVEDLEKKLDKDLHKKFEMKDNNVNDHHKEYLSNLFLEQTFSVTALNNYLKCPWNYFYNNLIRIPKDYSKQQKYGTAVHNTLNDFFNKYREDKNPDEKYLLERFNYFIERSNLSESELKELKKKGHKALRGYFNTYKNTWPKNILNEYQVFASISILKNKELTLSGKLDKVEIIEGSHVNVVDYKTANPKSRNEIEGKSKNSTGDYKRQLIFYKLLLENSDDKKFTMDTGEIDFLETNQSDKFKKEKFNISEEDVSELKDLIDKVSGEIYNLEFWNKRCDDKDCEYCSLRDINTHHS